jgi:hypothetical protein
MYCTSCRAGESYVGQRNGCLLIRTKGICVEQGRRESAKIMFFLIKPTDALIFPNLFLSRNSTCFGQFLCPSSGVFHCTFGTGIGHAGLMTHTNTECTVENSWWWAEELP